MIEEYEIKIEWVNAKPVAAAPGACRSIYKQGARNAGK
jgi:hypothetical protein